MTDPLLTYLSDHLAGSVHAIELLKNLGSHYKDQPLGQFAQEVFTQVDADRTILENLAEKVGGGNSTVKEAAAWASEKVSRVKLRLDDPAGLGVFESLEYLSIGILGKLALWRALALASITQRRLQGPDYDELLRRGQDQFNQVEKKRLELAEGALRPRSD